MELREREAYSTYRMVFHHESILNLHTELSKKITCALTIIWYYKPASTDAFISGTIRHKFADDIATAISMHHRNNAFY